MTSAEDFLAFNDLSVTPFHTVAAASKKLVAAGFSEHMEHDIWPGQAGKYFVVRSGSLIAWIEPDGAVPSDGFRILGAHTDSPHLRVKQHHDRQANGAAIVSLEPYGSPILSSWFDRDLGVAGRLVLSDMSERLVTIREPIVRVPNLAIHLDREKGQPSPQQHLNGLWAAQSESFLDFIAGRAGVSTSDIYGFELMLFDAAPASLVGADQAFISAPRLDNLGTVWAALEALEQGSGRRRAVVALFDHEEVGSESERGAGSPFLISALERIVLASGGSREELSRALACSVLVSGDMAHATHPNYPEKHEPLHQIKIGGGPVLKVNTNLRYATDARGGAFFAAACARANVPMQRFMSRADVPCGSTIGPIAAAKTGILTLDVGAGQLAMHSAREMMATADLETYGMALAACLEIDGFPT